jgi:hypothetical protein
MNLHMIQRHRNFLTVLAVAGFILLIGCTGNKKSNTATDSDTLADKETLMKEVFNYPLPTSFEVTKMLMDAGAPFIVSLCNPAENEAKYITQSQKALNLGIYGADLCYSSTYNQSQETMSYLNSSKKLVDDLNIATPFSTALVQRTEGNIQNKDSLISIISDSFFDTYNYLMANKQDKLSKLILAGSWVEALYISTQIGITAKKDEKMIEIVNSHMNAISKLSALMDPLKVEADVSPVYEKINSIKLLYDSFKTTKINQKQLAELASLTEKVRADFVK